MSAYRADEVSGRTIPQLNRTIVTAGCQYAAIRAEDCRECVPTMTRKRQQELSNTVNTEMSNPEQAAVTGRNRHGRPSVPQASGCIDISPHSPIVIAVAYAYQSAGRDSFPCYVCRASDDERIPSVGPRQLQGWLFGFSSCVPATDLEDLRTYFTVKHQPTERKGTVGGRVGDRKGRALVGLQSKACGRNGERCIGRCYGTHIERGCACRHRNGLTDRGRYRRTLEP